MGEFNHCIAISLAIVALIVVLGTYVTVDNQQVPEQAIAIRTGYPAWHPPIDGMNGQGNDELSVTVILYSAIMMILSGYLIFKWIFGRDRNVYKDRRKLTIFILNNEKTIPTIGFDIALGVYCLITALTGIMFLWVNVGKIWASFGALHNAVELVILVNMHYGGRITSNLFLGVLASYVLLNAGLSIFLPWPYDGLWFKMQGLCLDWALVIQFTRTYINTKKHIQNYHNVPLINDDGRDTRVSGDDERGERGEEEIEEGDVNQDSNEIIVRHPIQLLLLIFASGLHVFGNILSTIWVYDAISYEIFSYTYAITYPAYAYFVFLDTQAITVLPQKVICLPDTTKWKVILVTILSITLSLFTVRLGLPNIGSNGNDGDN